MTYRSEAQRFGVPDHMVGGIERYIEQRVPPGSFLSAVICNDLKQAVAKADDINMNLLPQYVKFFYNCAPSPCWGSPERMDAWLAGAA